MPGRLRTNFRSGNLTEHLGLLLLRGIAAAAEIPRTEDVGLDAVATLLRRATDGNCYAEDSFVVQLKSDSVTSMNYCGHQLSWFLGQSQPMFIGLVSRNDARISLHPTLKVNQAVLALHAEEVKMYFCRFDGPYQWAGGPANSATVWLGPPLLSWTLTEIDDEHWLASAFGILKRFLGMARREYELLSFGQCSELAWSTNEISSVRSVGPGMMKSSPESFRSLAAQCVPALNGLLLQAITMSEERGNLLAASLLSVIASLRDLGIDIESSTHMVETLSALKIQQTSGGQP